MLNEPFVILKNDYVLSLQPILYLFFCFTLSFVWIAQFKDYLKVSRLVRVVVPEERQLLGVLYALELAPMVGKILF